MNKFKVGDRVRVTDVTTIEGDTRPTKQIISVSPEPSKPQWNGKVTVDDKEYKIEWSHVRFDLGEPNPHKGLMNDYENHPEKYNLRAMSYCWITMDGSLGKVDDWGTALCTMSDNFCRKTGRKLSLDRALHSMFGNQDECRQVWEQVLQYPGLVK